MQLLQGRYALVGDDGHGACRGFERIESDFSFRLVHVRVSRTHIDTRPRLSVRLRQRVVFYANDSGNLSGLFLFLLLFKRIKRVVCCAAADDRLLRCVHLATANEHHGHPGGKIQ
jgi:hypothetical protein